MRLKQRVGDFRVRELLVEGFVRRQGAHRVYRVTKRKLTTPEAARVLADEAGLDVGEVQFAGLKDRQAITIQHMSAPGGRPVEYRSSELGIELIGFANEPLESAMSRGNAFELNVRSLRGDDLVALRMNLPVVRAHGLVNYFDDQRFGNLAHDQGWIARELMLGRHEQALRTLLAGHGPWESAEERHFKNALAAHWGDWRACRDDAGRFGAHHSVFEHLARHPNDFAGAFYHVATRVRLIHLYAWQSHVWNRAVTDLVREALPLADRVLLDCEEGVLVTHALAPPAALLARPTFRLPGERLEDVGDLVERRGVEAVLAREGVRPEEFRIEGVSGFKLKGEDRPLLVTPAHLRVRPADDDNLNPGTRMVRVRFELPRGAYATLVVKRLFSTPHGTVRREDRRPTRARERGGRDGRAGARSGTRPWPGKRQGSRPRAEGPPGGTGRRERRGGGGGGGRGPRR